MINVRTVYGKGQVIGVSKPMPIDLQATYRSFSPPLQADKRIRVRLVALERLNANIKSCALTAEKSTDHQLRGAPHRIAIAVTLADGSVIADHEHDHKQADEDFFVAVDDAFDVLEDLLKTRLVTQSDSTK